MESKIQSAAGRDLMEKGLSEEVCGCADAWVPVFHLMESP